MLESLLRKRYKLISVLGTGGFGQTYLAEDVDHPDQRKCVVKQFKPAKTETHFLAIARRLFHTEVKILEQLGQHPQIPTFLDFFEEDGEFYLVQEFIDGQSLSEVFLQKRLSTADAIDLLRDVLDVLSFVHSQQVIHRDIKPSNLIQRHSDGKIVLIDFGAVKEIRSQLLSETEQQFTVGIGTQGYTPSEQLAGQPRYNSDLYALGVTVIQGLTQVQPTQLLVEPESGELIWQTQAAVGSGLRDILQKMVRYHFSQRYQSAQEVLQAIDRLSDSAQESTLIPSALIMPSALLNPSVQDEAVADAPVRSPHRFHHLSHRFSKRIQLVAIAALSVTALVAGLRHLGWLQAPELAIYDQMMRLRPDPGVDPRLLIVEITEADLQTLQRGTPSDQDVAQVITTLKKHQPRVIGLDLHRDLPQAPGHASLIEQLQAADVITIMKLGDGETTFDIPPPAGVPAEQLGFNDFPIDPDGVVRRNLLYASTSGQTFASFSLKLALQYLATEGKHPQESLHHAGVMQIGETVFLPLKSDFGGYQQIDAAGYQILLDYRSAQQPARLVSFVDVLKGNIDPAWVKDKVVLIGTTAPSGKDLFYTPFSRGATGEHLMAGVIVHAQMVSQVLSVTLDQKSLAWALPDGVELLWIGGWAVIGGSLVGFVRHPLMLSVGTVGLLLALTGINIIIFTSYNGWLPTITPAVALILTGATVMSWRSYQFPLPAQSIR
jgi:CHASE2 domain-containing sensor protein/tRNA A-37 threonylcarbamoyl transferase component Bud32